MQCIILLTMLFLCLTQTNVKILNRNKKCVFATGADVRKPGNAQSSFSTDMHRHICCTLIIVPSLVPLVIYSSTEEKVRCAGRALDHFSQPWAGVSRYIWSLFYKTIRRVKRFVTRYNFSIKKLIPALQHKGTTKHRQFVFPVAIIVQWRNNWSVSVPVLCQNEISMTEEDGEKL